MQAIVFDFIRTRIGQVSTWAGLIVALAPLVGLTIDVEGAREIAEGISVLVGLVLVARNG